MLPSLCKHPHLGKATCNQGYPNRYLLYAQWLRIMYCNGQCSKCIKWKNKTKHLSPSVDKKSTTLVYMLSLPLCYAVCAGSQCSGIPHVVLYKAPFQAAFSTSSSSLLGKWKEHIQYISNTGNQVTCTSFHVTLRRNTKWTGLIN